MKKHVSTILRWKDLEGCCGFRGQQRKQMSGFLTIKAGVKSELLDSRSKEASVLWPHHEETRELPWERDNARNNARCTQARKTKARPGWTSSRRGQDSPWKSQSEWQRTETNGESTSMMWPTLGSRTAKEPNRTGLRLLYTVGVRASFHRFLGLNADSARCNSH